MQSQSYTVPSLNLTSSRSRKSIPTKDIYQSRMSNYQDFRSSNISSMGIQTKQQQKPRYLDKKTQSRVSYNQNPYLAPKTCQPRPNIPRPTQISRNVYLNYQTNQRPIQQIVQNQQYTSNVIERARNLIVRENSSKNLLRNPQSRMEIQNSINKQTNNMEFKKIDINKALFQRKLTKIFQQIDFYQDQLDLLCTDTLEDQIHQIQSIKKQNDLVHKKILRDLNSLII